MRCFSGASPLKAPHINLAIPASPPESGTLAVRDSGRTILASGLQDAQDTTISLQAQPDIRGRFTGSFQGMEQGVPVTIQYDWQVVTDAYIVGYLTASVSSQGVSCTVYRPYELIYSG